MAASELLHIIFPENNFYSEYGRLIKNLYNTFVLSYYIQI